MLRTWYLSLLQCWWIWICFGWRQHDLRNIPTRSYCLWYCCTRCIGKLHLRYLRWWDWGLRYCSWHFHCRIRSWRRSEVLDCEELMGNSLGRKRILQSRQRSQQYCHWKRLLMGNSCWHMVRAQTSHNHSWREDWPKQRLHKPTYASARTLVPYWGKHSFISLQSA